MAYQGFRILDVHAHFVYGRWPSTGPEHPALAAYARERDRRMREEWQFPGPPEPAPATPEEAARLADRWVEDLDRHGVDRITFVTGGGNERLAEVVRRHPDRFLGMVHHDPTAPDALEQLRRGVEEYGFVGYKMFGPRMPVPFEDPSLRPIWKYLAERRIPVLIHFGLLGHAGGIVYAPRMSPLTIWPVAREFLDIPFIIPHFGAGYWQDLLQLCWSLPNVYVDTSGSNQWMRWMPYPLTLESLLQKAYEMLGPERILFGTDSSWFPRGFVERYLADQLRAVRYLRWPEESIRLFLGGNAARLFGLRDWEAAA